MWPSSEACCFGAFKDSCTRLPKSRRPCWVVDSFYPARLCRQSTTLCGKQAKGKRSIPALGLAGVMHMLSLFKQSNPARSIFNVPVQPFPGPAVCSCSSNFHLCVILLAWLPHCHDADAGVQSWATKDACCAIGAAFGEGCSRPPPTPCWVGEGNVNLSITG